MIGEMIDRHTETYDEQIEDDKPLFEGGSIGMIIFALRFGGGILVIIGVAAFFVWKYYPR